MILRSRDDTWIWWALGALLLFGGGVATYELTRGLRNNNPGNIRKGSSDWLGMITPGKDRAFVEFQSMPYGIRAATVLFRNYQSLYGLNNIAQLIARWAPPGENDTAAYVDYVSGYTGIPATAQLNLRSAQVFPFLRAVFRRENGPLADTFISDEQLQQGVSMAV